MLNQVNLSIKDKKIISKFKNEILFQIFRYFNQYCIHNRNKNLNEMSICFNINSIKNHQKI